MRQFSILWLFVLCFSIALSVFCEPELFETIEEGDADDVKAKIKEGAKVNEKDKHGRTPLHKAAAKGDKEIVETLIEYGADVNAKDNKSETPLHAAAWNGNEIIVQTLVANKADAKAKNVNGKTADEISKALIERELNEIPREAKENKEEVETWQNLYDYKAIMDGLKKRQVGIEGFNLTIAPYFNRARDMVLEFDEDMNVKFHNGKKGDYNGTCRIYGKDVVIEFKGREGMRLWIIDGEQIIEPRTDIIFMLKKGLPGGGL
jgi:hypothetical protein